MFHLILTACLAASSGVCAPVLLPRGDAPDLAQCRAQAERIARDWLADHPQLSADAPRCVANADLPALALGELAPGVLVFLGDPVPLEDSADGRIANLGVVIGERSVAVIDSGVSRQQAQQLLVAIRHVTDKPISHVILSHMHPDHALGVSVLAEAGAQIVAHHALSRALGQRGRGYLDAMVRIYGPEAMLATQVVLPDRLIEDRDRIDLGGRWLTLRAAGTAHTDNDLTVLDEATGTLFTGDLVFRQLTPVVDGSLIGWLDWHRLSPDPAPRRIVPGHGAVAGDWLDAVTSQQALLQALAGATRAEIAEGRALSEAVPRIVAALMPLSEGWNAFAAIMARNATAAFKELEWEE